MRPIYEWLALSDLTLTMIGPPIYPERPIPSWEEFQADYPIHFFDGSAPELGRCCVSLGDGNPVGQVNSNDIHERDGRKRVELDLWMRAKRFCGNGYGPDAINTLCRHLSERYGCQNFLVQPSARNSRAIRAYGKAGFTRLGVPLREAREHWGPNDSCDSIYMVRTVPAGNSGSGA